jgi:quercetin dioxygenase-like cupin family protein
MSQIYWLFGAQLTILADEQQTNSTYDLVEGNFPAHMETPLHLHTKYSEKIYVLEGEFTVYTDTEVVTLRTGDFIFVAPNRPHVVAASGNQVNRALTIASPSGFGKLIRSVGIPGNEAHLPPDIQNDFGLFMELSKVTGDVILGLPGARPALKK